MSLEELISSETFWQVAAGVVGILLAILSALVPGNSAKQVTTSFSGSEYANNSTFNNINTSGNFSVDQSQRNTYNQTINSGGVAPGSSSAGGSDSSNGIGWIVLVAIATFIAAALFLFGFQYLFTFTLGAGVGVLVQSFRLFVLNVPVGSTGLRSWRIWGCIAGGVSAVAGIAVWTMLLMREGPGTFRFYLSSIGRDGAAENPIDYLSQEVLPWVADGGAPRATSVTLYLLAALGVLGLMGISIVMARSIFRAVRANTMKGKRGDREVETSLNDQGVGYSVFGVLLLSLLSILLASGMPSVWMSNVLST